PVPLRLEPLETDEGTAREAEFRVVVVLEDPRARPVRPVEESEPARGAQDRAERELIRRRDVRHARVRRGAFARRDVHPLLVDGDGYETGAGRAKRRMRSRVTRVLDPHLVSWIQEEAHCEIHTLLHSAQDEDLV